MSKALIIILLWVTAIFQQIQIPILGSGGSAPIVVTDNFTGSSLSANWTVLTSAGFVVASNAYGGSGTPQPESAAYWNANVFPANQYAQNVAVSAGGGSFNGVYVREQATGAATWANGYACFMDNAAANVQIYLFTGGGGGTQLATTAYTFHATDVLYFSAVGSSLTCKINGTTVLTATDTTWATGQPGIMAYNGGTAQTAGSFQAGSL